MDPWKTIAWSPEQEQIIYREWGLFYTKKQNQDVAEFYYNKSLALNPIDPKALHFRSQCQRHIALTEEALLDSSKALELDELNQPYNLEVCDGVYELNEFEKSKILLSNYSRKFKGKKVNAFRNRIDVLNENFEDALGDKLGNFILENGKQFDKVNSEMLVSRTIDPRPMWKIMKHLEQCDVLSVLEMEREILSPGEVAKRKRSFTWFNQIYLRRSWIDVLFLKTLMKNKNLMLPQSLLSRPLLEDLTKHKYDVVWKMLKMLNARSPLYTEKIRNCPSQRMRMRKTEEFLFHAQNQAHRSLLKILKTMHLMRLNRKLEKLQKYVEQVMGDYIVLKTRRVMPWKFQFINEVYNLLALALVDQFEDTPENLADIPQKDRLIVLLKLQSDMEKEPVQYEFGNRATYQDADAADKNAAQLKSINTRLIKRLEFAKYPIERAYLWHEVASTYLKLNQFDKCCSIADRCISEATKCNSFVWMLHATMLVCKTHALLRKIEKVSTTLLKALSIAESLKSENITHFLLLCVTLNKADIKAKKTSEALRSTKSRISLYSSRSTRSEKSE